MNSKLIVAALMVASGLFALPGCAADAGDTAGPDSEETAGVSQDELTSSAARLVGAFHGSNAGRPPSFDGIVFKQSGDFLADVDTGIRCVRAPCPSNVRLNGKFTATRTFITLSPVTPTAPMHTFHGKYRYKLVGDKLSLTRDGAEWQSWSNALAKSDSYCAEATDCAGQMLIVPACVGQFTCGEQRSCGFDCGLPETSIWPSDKKQLVAESSGGGFTAPPPPGSTCAVGAQKYTLDVASRKLSSVRCEFDNTSGTLKPVNGARTISSADLAKVDAAMKDVTISNDEICGADKPFLTLKVTSAAHGEKTYTDSFYSCMGGGRTFVDNIESAFGALRELAQQ
jgi:hypothetical protein